MNEIDDELRILEPLEALAAARPRALALREASRRAISYRHLCAATTALTESFLALGMAPGEHVLFSVRPGIDAVMLALAVCGAGGVLVPCDPGMGDAVFATRLGMLAPRWVIAESLLLAATSGGILSRVLRYRGSRLAPLGQMRGVHFVRVGPPIPGGPPASSARALARLAVRSTRPRVLEPTLPALVEFTSGTTASPKAVVHTRRSLAATVAAVRNALGLGERDTVYSGALHLIVPAVFAGSHVVIPRRGSVSARQTIRDVERWNVSHVFSSASHARRLVDECVLSRRCLPASIRVLLLGGSPVHVSLLRRLRQVLRPGTRVVCVYGMTEILPAAVVSLEEKLAFDGDGDLLGVPVGGVRARISAHGELLLSGRGLFDRYLGGPQVTEHATGDLARIEKGQLVLLGRAKDMIIRGDVNIYPELHEPIIERIPGVRRCALIGVYREELADEFVVLVVEPEPGLVDTDRFEARLRRELRSGEFRIDASAQPDFIVMMSLPESGRSEKVDKAALRALVAGRLACA